ncbi:MAG: hypothetical protein IT373_25820 [Polyangiaceae bacterium]|nr:hypothetical protein [Polyangiaceae bacterium]
MRARAKLLPWLFGLAALAPAAACGSKGGTPFDPTTTSAVTFEYPIVDQGALVIVLVVDDADTPDAAALRGRVLEALAGSLLSEVDDRFGCGPGDPARWRPAELRVVVARPSAPDAEALVTPIDTPALDWIEPVATVADAEAVRAATGQVLAARLALPGETFRPLHAAQRVMDLLSGARPPEAASETAFVSSLRETTFVQVVVAGTRDDEDTAPVASLAPGVGTSSAVYLVPTTVILPATAFDYGCTPTPGTTRLEAWDANASLYGWPCTDQAEWDGMLRVSWVDCGPWCESNPITVDLAGRAACTFYVDQPDLAQCDPVFGWRDPDGTATLVDHAGTSYRRCEIVQLEGAALDSCRTSLACPDCTSGFCVTEVPELTYGTCGPGEHRWKLRFVGGAVDVTEGYIGGTCLSGLGM